MILGDPKKNDKKINKETVTSPQMILGDPPCGEQLCLLCLWQWSGLGLIFFSSDNDLFYLFFDDDDNNKDDDADDDKDDDDDDDDEDACKDALQCDVHQVWPVHFFNFPPF